MRRAKHFIICFMQQVINLIIQEHECYILLIPHDIKIILKLHILACKCKNFVIMYSTLLWTLHSITIFICQPLVVY